MIHTKNGFIGEDDCSNDPCVIGRVSFFSSLSSLPPSYIGLLGPTCIYIVCKRILLVVVVIDRTVKVRRLFEVPEYE